VPLLGTLLKNRRAGETNLAWNLPALAGPELLEPRSASFEHDGAIPQVHAGRRAGGQNLSPPLTWARAPEGTAALLLVIQDVDSPTGTPFVHCVALLEPGLDALPAGALNADRPAPGVRVLRSGMGRGYLGPEPIKGHGPHRYRSPQPDPGQPWRQPSPGRSSPPCAAPPWPEGAWTDCSPADRRVPSAKRGGDVSGGDVLRDVPDATRHRLEELTLTFIGGCLA
jgi:Phosphatidylethanolamine-binding protein